MINSKTNFSAVDHGFRFPNRFEFNFSVMFELPFVSPINLDKVVYGLCGGMCFGALDYFNAALPIPRTSKVKDINSPFLLYLWDRQLDSLKLPVVFKVMEWMILDDGNIGRRMSRWEIPKLKRRIDKGNPAVLALIRTQGVSDPTQNHQVMATAYRFDEATRDMVIHLYDPNHPGKNPRLNLNLSNPSQGIPIEQSTGEELRGFFVLNYRTQKPFSG